MLGLPSPCRRRLPGSGVPQAVCRRHGRPGPPPSAASSRRRGPTLSGKNRRAMVENPPRRLGPRPLPLHLMAAGLTWASSRNALPLWSSGSPLLRGTLGKGELAERAAALRQSLDGTAPAAFARRSEEATHESQSVIGLTSAA